MSPADSGGVNTQNGDVTTFNVGTYGEDVPRLKAYEPNFFGSIYEKLDNSEAHVEFTGKFIYSILDDAYVSFAQIGPYRRRLDGSGVWPKKVTDAGVNTLITVNPWASLSLGIPSRTLNAGQFNHLYTGTGLNSARSGLVRTYNYIIRNYHRLQRELVPFMNWKGLYDTTENTLNE